jgi:hypothetical protein
MVTQQTRLRHLRPGVGFYGPSDFMMGWTPPDGIYGPSDFMMGWTPPDGIDVPKWRC